MNNLQQVLDFLNRNKIRATYRDVASFLGVSAVSLFEKLEPRRPEASWVVNYETGTPSGYSESESAPELRSSDIISDEFDLRKKMQLDKKAPRQRRVPALKSK